MSIPAESFLLQNEVQLLNANPHKQLTGSGGDNVLQLDIADLSDLCPVNLLQTLVWLCQQSSLTGMEHCALHTTPVYTATCLEKELAGRVNQQQLLELLPGGFHMCCGSKFTAISC